MKRLKETTIKRYDARSLRRHLDRLLNAFKCAPYRITPYEVRKTETYPDFNDDGHSCAYWHYCNLHDRDAIIDAIYDVYRRLGL